MKRESSSDCTIVSQSAQASLGRAIPLKMERPETCSGSSATFLAEFLHIAAAVRAVFPRKSSFLVSPDGAASASGFGLQFQFLPELRRLYLGDN